MNDDIDYLDSELSEGGAPAPKGDEFWVWFLLFAAVVFLVAAVIARFV